MFLFQELEQRQKEKLKEKEKEKKRRAKLRKKAEKDRAEEEARLKKVPVLWYTNILFLEDPSRNAEVGLRCVSCLFPMDPSAFICCSYQLLDQFCQGYLFEAVVLLNTIVMFLYF